MKLLPYGAILIAALAMVSILPQAVPAQDAAGFDRDSCIRGSAWLMPIGYYNYGRYLNYYNCLSSCESRFWREFDKNTEDLEKELK